MPSTGTGYCVRPIGGPLGCLRSGFKVIDHPSGKGKGLDTDPEGEDLLYGMATRLLDGWSFIRIAAWLNDDRVH